MGAMKTDCILGQDLLKNISLRMDFKSRSLRHAIKANCQKTDLGILSTKAGMTTWFMESGEAVPCTVLAVLGENIVTRIFRSEVDGYSAVQVGYGMLAERKLSKPKRCQLRSIGAPALRHLV